MRMGKITGLIKAVAKFAKSDKGKKIGKAAVNFVKDTGLAKKAADSINAKVAKKTSKNSSLDKIRQVAYEEALKHTGSNGPTKGFGDAALGFANESGLGEEALKGINSKIEKKTRNNPALETIRKLALSEAQKAIPFSSGSSPAAIAAPPSMNRSMSHLRGGWGAAAGNNAPANDRQLIGSSLGPGQSLGQTGPDHQPKSLTALGNRIRPTAMATQLPAQANVGPWGSAKARTFRSRNTGQELYHKLPGAMPGAKAMTRYGL